MLIIKWFQGLLNISILAAHHRHLAFTEALKLQTSFHSLKHTQPMV